MKSFPILGSVRDDGSTFLLLFRSRELASVLSLPTPLFDVALLRRLLRVVVHLWDILACRCLFCFNRGEVMSCGDGLTLSVMLLHSDLSELRYLAIGLLATRREHSDVALSCLLLKNDG